MWHIFMDSIENRPTEGEDRPLEDSEIEPCFWYDVPEDRRLRADMRTVEELMVFIGAFRSRGQARQAGFSGPIPVGCNLIGTKKHRAWVWRTPFHWSKHEQVRAGADHSSS